MRPENISTAIGLMLTIGAARGFLLPWGFGLLVPTAGYDAAWAMLGLVTLASGLATLRRPTPPRQSEPTPGTLPATEIGAS